jgi:hypothetical protein
MAFHLVLTLLHHWRPLCPVGALGHCHLCWPFVSRRFCILHGPVKAFLTR